MDSTKDFVDVITTAWNQLDAEQIVKHLDESFRYDSLSVYLITWIIMDILIISVANSPLWRIVILSSKQKQFPIINLAGIWLRFAKPIQPLINRQLSIIVFKLTITRLSRATCVCSDSYEIEKEDLRLGPFDWYITNRCCWLQPCSHLQRQRARVW